MIKEFMNYIVFGHKGGCDISLYNESERITDFIEFNIKTIGFNPNKYRKYTGEDGEKISRNGHWSTWRYYVDPLNQNKILSIDYYRYFDKLI